MENKNKVKAINQNSEIKSYNPPAGVISKMYIYHLGVILSNISMVCCILASLAIFSFIIPAVYFIALIGLVLVSIGTIFVFVPNFGSAFEFGADLSSEIIPKVIGAFPYLAAIALITAAVSMVLLLLDKNNRDWGRIGFSIGILSIVVILIIIIIVGALA